MKQKPSELRINILDSFRFLAILLVILYHYLHRFAGMEGLYPQGTAFSEFPIAKFGHTGVQLFFIISGFVIFLTLERAATFKEFLVKRFIRLFPMLLICSVCSFTFVGLLDEENRFPHFHSSVFSFLPSLTFTEPYLWKTFVHPEINSFVDGVYWTLAIEVKFYALMGIVYFLNKSNFFKNWIGLTILILLIHYAVLINNHAYHFSDNLALVDGVFGILFFPEYILYFTLGVIFFMLYQRRKMQQGTLVLIGLFIFGELAYFLKGPERVFFATYICLFLGLIYKPRWIRKLSVPLFEKVGLVSYPLYLIHQNLGVLAIHKFAHAVGDKNGILSILTVSSVIILVAYFMHSYIDHPLQKSLKALLVARKAKPMEIRKVSLEEINV